jgi:predicted RNA binding protein YcfA (HicA-like mRNA interferase family)
MVGYTKKLKKLLKEAGCEFHQQGKGDHETWKTPDGKFFTVDNDIKSRHTANETLKQAGLAKAF